MKKQEFLDELGKRFKYVHYIVNNAKGFNNLVRDEVVVAIINSGQVYRDVISFWVRNEKKPDEEILDVEWDGSYSKIDTEIENILKGSDIHCGTEKYKKRKM